MKNSTSFSFPSMRVRFEKKRKTLLDDYNLKNKVVSKLIDEIEHGFKDFIRLWFLKYFEIEKNHQRYLLVWDGEILRLESEIENDFFLIYSDMFHNSHKFWKSEELQNLLTVDKTLKYIGYIPNEIYCNIFKYLKYKDLSNCRQVCKSWSEMIHIDVKRNVLLKTLDMNKYVSFDTILNNITSRWRSKYAPTLSYYILHPTKYFSTFGGKQEVRCVCVVTSYAGKNVKAYAAGIIDQRAVVWITPKGKLMFIDELYNHCDSKEKLFELMN